MRTPKVVPLAYHRAPSGTSKIAAVRVGPKAPSQRERILAELRSVDSKGLTDEEGHMRTRIRLDSYSPRRGELVRLGLVVDSGRRRKTTSGCPAAVWVVRETECDGMEGDDESH